MSSVDVGESLTRARGARDRALAWLLDRVGTDGAPEGHENGNSWSRLPWAFALSGETAAGASVLAWAERSGLREDGDFVAPAYGSGRMGAYPLGHLAMGAALLERHDILRRLMDRLSAIQTPTGGFPVDPPGGEAAHLCDLLSTAQAGQAAILAGRPDIYEPVFGWIRKLRAGQTEWPHVLHSGMVGEIVEKNPPASLPWLLITDFTKPRQSYFTSGIAAMFLAAYGARTGNTDAFALGHDFLSLNIAGTEEQFSDLSSVQACKFGWGIAAMQIADPRAEYTSWLQRMADWFVVRLDGEGAWRPSTFVSPNPFTSERMVKTAEHLMELTAIISALAATQARGA